MEYVAMVLVLVVGLGLHGVSSLAAIALSSFFLKKKSTKVKKIVAILLSILGVVGLSLVAVISGSIYYLKAVKEIISMKGEEND
jgi:hypothetical protein